MILYKTIITVFGLICYYFEGACTEEIRKRKHNLTNVVISIDYRTLNLISLPFRCFLADRVLNLVLDTILSVGVSTDPIRKKTR